MKKVKSLYHLKRLCRSTDGGRQNFFIAVAGGAGRSSKQIGYNPETKLFEVLNEINDHWQCDLTEEELTNETHIVDAINNGALYKYDF